MINIKVPEKIATHMLNFLQDNSDVTYHWGDDNPSEEYELFKAALAYAIKECE